mgnify:CR=1 FL=1|jgi:hypothetical protein
MIYVFWIIMVYLITLMIYGINAYVQIDEFHFSMKETLIEKKTRSIKSRYGLCLLRYSSQ